MIEYQIELNKNNEKIVQLKEEEYLKYLNQLKISFQIEENQLNQQKNSLQNPNNEKINELIKEKENSLINHLNLQINHLKELISSEKSLKNLQTSSNPSNLNENLHFIFNIYQNQLEHLPRIKSPSDEIEEIFNEQFDKEFNEFYLDKLRRIVNEHYQLENELILYEIRVIIFPIYPIGA